MSFLTWLFLGAGIFLLYSAYKGNNPLASLAGNLGIKTKTPAKVGPA